MPLAPGPHDRATHCLLQRMAAAALATTLVASLPAAPNAGTLALGQDKAGTADCVAIGRPKPSVTYTYRLTQSTGGGSQYTQRWEEVTDTGSRVRVNGPRGFEIVANQHRIVNDVAVLSRTRKASASGAVIETTTFQPGLVSDPAFRACIGTSWTIPSVSASYQSNQQNASMPTPAGTLKIIGIREKVAVPAGTFDAVHYVRTSQSTDEYWKAIDHGVVVRHIGVLPNGRVIEELIAIK